MKTIYIADDGKQFEDEYECRTCANYNPLRMLYEKEKNDVQLGVPIEVVPLVYEGTDKSKIQELLDKDDNDG